MFPESIYMNCDLPSVVRRLEDPEIFFNDLDNNKIVVFDEVHKLADPGNLLKIAADSFPSLKILATGSSTLAATKNERNLFYWRDKSGREIDFIIKKNDDKVDAIECKINPDNFNTKSLVAFRKIYPQGTNYCISPFIQDSYKIRKNDLIINFTSLEYLFS